MATVDVDVASTPSILPGLANGERYSLQNKSVVRCYVSISTIVVDNSNKSSVARNVIPANLNITPVVSKSSGEEVYIWCDEGRESLVALNPV